MASRGAVSLMVSLVLCVVCSATRDAQGGREAARKSMVLLKNGDDPKMPLIPLEKKAIHILVVGSYANKASDGTTILNGIKETVAKTTKVTYKESPTADFVKSTELDYSIVVVGADSGFETVKNVCNDVRCVVVVISGKPSEEIMKEADVVVTGNGDGQGVVDVLFGDYPFSEKHT